MNVIACTLHAPLDPFMSQMLPVAGTSSFIVTADDGTLFHCQPHQISHEGNGNGGAKSEARWIFMDTRHVSYVGPVYNGQVAPQTLQRMLTEWWRGARDHARTRSRDTSQF